MPVEIRLEINAKRRADYQRKKLARESVNPPSNTVEHTMFIPGNHVDLTFHVADEFSFRGCSLYVLMLQMMMLVISEKVGLEGTPHIHPVV
jgi:hypothetical protein